MTNQRPSLETMIEDVSKSLSKELGAQPSGVQIPAPADEWGERGREAVMRIPVSVRIVIGATRMPISKLMKLTRGSIIPLDRKVGDLVDIVVNDRIVARGEIVVSDLEADRYAVAIQEVVTTNDDA